MRFSSGLTLAMLGWTGGITAALAQTDSTQKPQLSAVNAAEQTVLAPLSFGRTTDVLPSAASSPQGSDSSKIAQIAQLSASNSNGQASFKITGSYRGGTYTTKGQDMIGHTTLDTWSAVFSAPTSTSTSNAAGAIATDTLPSSFQVKLGFSRFIGDMVIHTGDEGRMQRAARKNCQLDYLSKQANALDIDADTDTPAEMEAKKEANAKLQAAAESVCQVDNNDAVIAKHLPDQKGAFGKTSISTSYLWGLDASAGYNDNTYYLASTAAKLNSQDVPWSVDAFAGITPNTALLLLGSVAYQKTYTAQKSATLCPTSATAAVLQCATGSVGPPKEQGAVLLSFEPRYQFSTGKTFSWIGVNGISIDPKFSYDVKNDVFGFNTQIVLGQVSSKSGSGSGSDSTMAAGVQFGWQSDKHVFVGGVFASAPLSFFSGPS
jgi:hypothetical protein